MISPFPARTRVVLTMQRGESRSSVDGVVRVMHPEIGMGLEFRQSTEQPEQIERFVQAMKVGTAPLEFTVLPEGMDDEDVFGNAVETPALIEDPLLNLFRRSTEFTTETFREELRNQRRAGLHRQSTCSAAG
jgi:hypothetical protein